jgi:filamentous hemagglutinin family protein
MKKFVLGLAALFFSAANIYAQEVPSILPQGPNVVSGNADISTSGNNMNITTSDKSIINWNSYNISSTNTVNYQQPSASSVSLNRVTGIEPSGIYGALTSNGQVFVVNPNGIVFGANSRVDVPGLVASTLDINNNDFLNGNYSFYQNGSAAGIVNQGAININSGGFAALLSNSIDNQGSIVAPLGRVALASGERVVLGLDEFMSVVVDKPNTQAISADMVRNTGRITADGGQIVVNASMLRNIFDNAVNNTGIMEANTLENKNGVIKLFAQGGDIASSSESTMRSNEVLMQAETGLSVNTESPRVSAVVTDQGNLKVVNKRDGIINGTTANGSIWIEGYGPTRVDAASITDADTNDIDIRTFSNGIYQGDLVVGNVDAGNVGDVIIITQDGSIQHDTNPATRVTGDYVLLGSYTGIGGLGTVETSANSITAYAARTGSIDITNFHGTDTIFEGNSPTGGIYFTQRGAGDLLLRGVTSGRAGGLNLTSVNSDIRGLAGNYLSAETMSLSTPNGTVGADNPLSVYTLGSLSLNVGGQENGTSARLNGSIGQGKPTLAQNPPGYVYYNGVQIWPIVDPFGFRSRYANMLRQSFSGRFNRGGSLSRY